MDQQTRQIEQAFNQVLTQPVRYTAKDGAALPADWYLLVDASNSALTVTLPLASAFIHLITIKKVEASGNTITIAGTQGQTVDGAATVAISTAWASVGLVSDGKNWFIV